MEDHSYCKFVAKLNDDNLHKVYHDTKYGFAVNDDNELFGRLILEINRWSFLDNYTKKRK